jgi:glycosyltransferase involved in cell wall biosynthesis
MISENQNDPLGHRLIVTDRSRRSGIRRGYNSNLDRRPVIRTLVILEAETLTGPAKAVLEFAREAKRASHPRIELTILTFARNDAESDFARAVREEGIPIEIVRERGRFDTAVLARLREIVRERKPDVLWTNAVKSHFLARAAGLHRMTRWMAYHHGYTTTDWATRAYNQLDRWSLRVPDRFVTVCNAFASDSEARGVRRERIRVEPVPIRPSTAEPDGGDALREKLRITREETVLLAVGRLSKEKGHAELLRAVAHLHSARPAQRLRLLLVGGGPEERSLRSLCAELKIDHLVVFCGHQPRVRDYYTAADIFALPSHSEGSPTVLLEALDAGVPVVATAVGGIPEMVTNEVNSLLTPRGDIAALATAIGRLIGDPALRERFRAAGREVLIRYSPERYFRNIACLLSEIAQGV